MFPDEKDGFSDFQVTKVHKSVGNGTVSSAADARGTSVATKETSVSPRSCNLLLFCKPS